MSTPITEPVALAQVEQRTGLSREVLRKWELRFQFPTPHRGARGQRLYQEKEVVKLMLIQQLLGRGMRPRHVVPLPMEALEQLHAQSLKNDARLDVQADVNALLNSLVPGAKADAVHKQLESAVEEIGLARFVDEVMPAFNAAVGQAWRAGRLGVHAEHRFTDALHNVVRVALAGITPGGGGARVLVTTPPGELHSLGLLGVKAALTLCGAECISLGTQTPGLDVVHAVQEWNIDVVGLSLSASLPEAVGLAYVQELRRALPPACRLWLGGAGATALAGRLPGGVEVFASTAEVVKAWLKLNGPA